MAGVMKVINGLEHPNCVCMLCLAAFKEKKNLNIHIKSVHSDKKLKCDLCDLEFNRSYSLKRHMKTHAKSTQGNNQEVSKRPKNCKYICMQCLGLFTTNKNLNRHVAAAHGESKLNCDECGYTTTRSDNKKDT